MPANLYPAIDPHQEKLSPRRHPRTLFSVPITLRHLCRGGVRASRGITLDLAEGGLGAIVQGDVHVGDTVAIDLRLSEQLLTTVAIVRHTSSVRSGFEFVGLTPEERLQIMSVIGQS
jgi:PilZ domain-containing protein